MKPRKKLSKVFVMMTAVALALPAAWAADAVRKDASSDDPRVVEAGPEDGISCCNGLTAFLFDGEDVLVTTGRAGIFRFDHRDQRWQRAMQGLVAPNHVSPFVNDICQAPSRPSVVYAVAGLGTGVPFMGLFSSDDFGQSWTRRAAVPLGFNSLANCAVDADDPRTIYISARNFNFGFKLWKSTDSGRTVQTIGADLPAPVDSEVPFVRASRGTIYASFFAGLFASADGGATFRRLPTPPGPVRFFATSADGRAIFADIDDATTGVVTVFRSIDGGASFVPVSGLPKGFGDLAFDPTDPSRIYASYGFLYLSSDGGLSFAVLPASNDPRFLGGSFPVIEIGVDGRGSVYLDTLGGPFRTDDRGQTFHSLLDGLRASAVQDLAFDADGKLLVGVLHTQAVFRQKDGIDFRPIGTPLMKDQGVNTNAASIAASPTDANVVLVATVGEGLFRTDDGGTTWTSPVVSGAPTIYGNSRMAFPTSSRVYLASPGFPGQDFPGQGLYRSDDAGQSFALLSSLPFGALAVDPTNPDVLYLGTYSSPAGLFKSTDGGQTLQTLGRSGGFSAIVVDRRNPEVIYAGGKFGRVLRSVDGGRTFTPASDGLDGAGVHGLAQDSEGTLFVWLRGGGLFSSRDGADSWQPVDVTEALWRSGVEAGRGSLVADPHHPGRVYLGNAGVIQIEAGNHGADGNSH